MAKMTEATMEGIQRVPEDNAGASCTCLGSWQTRQQPRIASSSKRSCRKEDLHSPDTGTESSRVNKQSVHQFQGQKLMELCGVVTALPGVALDYSL